MNLERYTMGRHEIPIACKKINNGESTNSNACANLDPYKEFGEINGNWHLIPLLNQIILRVDNIIINREIGKTKALEYSQSHCKSVRILGKLQLWNYLFTPRTTEGCQETLRSILEKQQIK